MRAASVVLSVSHALLCACASVAASNPAAPAAQAVPDGICVPAALRRVLFIRPPVSARDCHRRRPPRARCKRQTDGCRAAPNAFTTVHARATAEQAGRLKVKKRCGLSSGPRTRRQTQSDKPGVEPQQRTCHGHLILQSRNATPTQPAKRARGARSRSCSHGVRRRWIVTRAITLAAAWSTTGSPHAQRLEHARARWPCRGAARHQRRHLG